MADKPEQFFKQPKPTAGPARLPGGNVAIYELQRQGRLVTVAVECAEGNSNVPQNATSVKDVVRKLDLGGELDVVSAMAETVLEKLKALMPGEMEIEFGIELGGEMGIPMVTKGEAKANFKVTLKWKDRTEAEK